MMKWCDEMSGCANTSPRDRIVRQSCVGDDPTLSFAKTENIPPPSTSHFPFHAFLAVSKHFICSFYNPWILTNVHHGVGADRGWEKPKANVEWRTTKLSLLHSPGIRENNRQNNHIPHETGMELDEGDGREDSRQWGRQVAMWMRI